MIETTEEGSRFIMPSANSFNELEEFFHILIDDVYYEVIVEKEDDCIWFAFDYGKPDPIDDKLTNVKTGIKKNNLRKNDETELLHQLFALYDFNKKLLYISNSNKKNVFKQMLQEKLQKLFIVKKFFKPKDEFIKILKEVDEISFTEANDLFSQDSKKRQALIDLTGTDAPEKFTLCAKYKKNSKIIDFIKNLIKSKNNTELNELVIKGVDNDNFEFIFNVDSFVQRISIFSKKNEKGKFEAELTKQKLLTRLSNEG
jgi:hypothetical protein